MKDKIWLIECECHTLEHMIALRYDPEYKELSINYQIKQYRNFFQRLWLAVKYLLNFKGQSHWDETLISPEAVAKIREWLDSK